MNLLFFILIIMLMPLIHEAYAFPKSYIDVESQIAMEITVYNSNLGLVKDQRQIKLESGLLELQFVDVASNIIPTSVSIKSAVNPDSLKVLEQKYEYDLISPQKLLNKYVGKEVMLYSKNFFTDKEELIKAKIISNNDLPVYQIGQEITFGHPGRVIFPEIPKNLISKPTLTWLIENKLAGNHKIEVRYLTQGINWNASYVMVLNDKDDRADLSAWINIDNKSGASYKDARLKLVAGDINRADEMQPSKDKIRSMASLEEPKTQFTEKDFFEYHIYTLDRATTLENNQIKQISLFDVRDIAIKKYYLLSGAQYYYKNKYGEIFTKRRVPVFIEITNNKASNLGVPIPKGLLRLYKYDQDGSLQLIGETLIDHTPKDEKLNIKVGEAFDIIATKKQIDWKRISDRLYEISFEISIMNYKSEDIVVTVIEPIPGEWKIIQASHDYKKKDAFTISFDIVIPQKRESKLFYLVSLKF
ncbi:MAG: hypothetical protein N3A59_06625 [Thermodesulfovibrionales bacterium]|nr:hypothetical protein [Thermodesulfovibrionales bacterium]